MPDTPSYGGDLERAYHEAAVGAESPTLIAISGALWLQARPYLVGQIDPTRTYYVTKDAIVLVEDD